MSDEEMTEVRIGLPLPIDVTATLIQVIGLTWPGAVIKDDGHTWKHERQLVLGIPEKERHKTAKAAEKYAKRKQHLNANADSVITELGPNGAGWGIPDYLARTWVAMVRECWEQYPDAKNYLESTVYDKDTHQRYVFYVARSEQQTPHELRIAADKLAEERLTEINRLNALVASLSGEAEPK